MPEPLTRAQLDVAVCQKPGCTHTTHDDIMMIRGRCHPFAGISLELDDGVLRVSCPICQRPVVDIALDLPPNATVDLRSESHPHSGFSCGYQHGHMHLRCMVCEQPIATLPVAAGAIPDFDA